MSEIEKDKLELKIVVYWARGIAAAACSGECRCAQVYSILNSGMKNPGRKDVLKEAPNWVRKAWPQYYED